MAAPSVAKIPAVPLKERGRAAALATGRLLSLLWLVVGLAALVWGGYGLVRELERKAPLAVIQVEGDISPADREELAKRLKPVVRGSYFTTDLVAIRDAVLASPWVESMSVQRRWPDGIRVTVVEKKPVARWGDKSLISANGELFAPKPGEGAEGLPLLIGPAGKTGYVMEQFRSFNDRFRAIGVQVVELHLTERMTWFMRLNTGMELIVDAAQLNEKLQRFFWLYGQELKPFADRLSRVDLRYRNGFAVAWKEGRQVAVVNNQFKKPEQALNQDGR